MTVVTPGRDELERAVGEVLAKNVWPVYRSEDDRGLERDEYVSFVQEVFARIAAKPADEGVREEPEAIAARICEKIWSKKYQTLRTMEKVSIAEAEIVKAIKAERVLSTTGEPKR